MSFPNESGFVDKMQYKWCGLEPLGVAFPSLYAMTASKGAYVADCKDHEGEFWNPRSPRDFNDWELE